MASWIGGYMLMRGSGTGNAGRSGPPMLALTIALTLLIALVALNARCCQ